MNQAGTSARAPDATGATMGRAPGGAGRSFTTRLCLALMALLLGFAFVVGLLAREVLSRQEDESLQRLSHGLARHIVAHWPAITQPDRDAADRTERQALLRMLMVVNPAVQVYVLDANGRVDAYIGEPGMVRQHQVDLDPVRRFLGGAAPPLRGTDPMGGSAPRLFSAAMFAQRQGDSRPPGYLYVVLDSAARQQVASQLSPRYAWQGVAWAVAAAGLLTLALGLFTFRRLSLPLRLLAQRMQRYSSASPTAQPLLPMGDEVTAIEQAFDDMTARIEAQAERERENAERERSQAAAHRESMASIAHDLRTPLTALHGQLEALANPALASVHPPERLLGTALAQSNKVRRLSQQLFELAALQSAEQLVHLERFNLDELVSDAVHKLDLGAKPALVQLSGPAPGPLALDGDLQLIERALTNLIDNALRHGGDAGPVRVSLQRLGQLAQVLIEDHGPGLPAELHARLAQGASLRDPPLRRSSGGIGGLGLAIAQRIAMLHGGSLQPLPAPDGGTRLCLALPLAS